MARKATAPIVWRNGRAYLDARAGADVGGKQEALTGRGDPSHHGSDRRAEAGRGRYAEVMGLEVADVSFDRRTVTFNTMMEGVMEVLDGSRARQNAVFRIQTQGS